MEASLPIVVSALGGMLPALFWLWFWLREDRRHPEPRHLILLAFVVGMLTVAVVIPIQKAAQMFIATSTLMYTAWSFIEEIVKYVMARVTVLWRRDVNEPLDPLIYMIIVALGFAAAENTLFLLSPLSGETVVDNVITGNFRFVGATLLHVVSSAIVGMLLAFTFYKPHRTREAAAWVGVILASVLHSIFNFLILNTPSEYLLWTFGLVWVGVFCLFALFEVVKRIHRRR